MKYLFIVMALALLSLTACGKQEPGGAPGTDKELGVSAKEIYPADDPTVPHAKSEAEKQKALSEKAYPADDPAAPHAKTEAEKHKEKLEEAYPADDPALPHAE